MQALRSSSGVTEAKRYYLECREHPTAFIQPDILDSWSRCQEYGFQPSERNLLEPVSKSAIKDNDERRRNLISSMDEEIKNLGQMLANTHYMGIITDSDGVVLRVTGNQSLAGPAVRAAARPGVDLSEQKIGTNAAGTSLINKKPVIVRGPEHFFDCHVVYDCVAAPIFSPTGEVLGALDITGEGPRTAYDLMRIAEMSIRRIENMLLRNISYDLLVRFHSDPSLLGTPLEGLLALSEDGRIIGLNSGASSLLACAHKDAIGSDFSALFDSPLSRMIKLSAPSTSAPVRLAPVNGISFSTRLEFSKKSFAICRNDEEEMTAAISENRTQGHPSLFSSTGIAQPTDADPRIGVAFDRAKKAFKHGLAVLVCGETGSGKEVFAKKLHDNSQRRNSPFIPVNCAAIPDGLIESELFGHTEGAFTGARKGGGKGKLELAHGGTLFLDEIGDMPFPLQARLLRVLQDREIWRLGATAPIEVEFSLVCATNCNLEELIAKKLFREDLYYRLNGIQVTLPPLRERSDFDALVRSILRDASPAILGIHPDTMDMLSQHHWPGNIRQLRSALIAALSMLADDEDEIRPHHFPEAISEKYLSQLTRPSSEETQTAKVPTLADSELAIIQRTLAEYDGNIAATAKHLRISRGTLYRKLSITNTKPPGK